MGREVNNLIADLHMHSTFSDGKFTPLELDSMYKKSSIKTISITDHDTFDHLNYINSNIKNFSLDVIPGVEVSCHYKNINIHILIYNVNSNIKFLSNYFEDYRNRRINRIQRIIENLKKSGIILKLDEILKKNINPSRLHIARKLVENGYSKSIKSAFKKFLIKTSKFYVPIKKIQVEELALNLKEMGCVLSIAHPIISLGKNKINLIKKMNINAVEVYHPTHSFSDKLILLKLCKEHKLLITGGSDFHGWVENDCRLGKYGLTDKDYKNIYNKLND